MIIKRSVITRSIINFSFPMDLTSTIFYTSFRVKTNYHLKDFFLINM